MSSIKYLRPQSTVMISAAGTKKDKVAIATGATNDVLLGLTVSYSDGSGEELIGIQISDRQLEQLTGKNVVLTASEQAILALVAASQQGLKQNYFRINN